MPDPIAPDPNSAPLLIHARMQPQIPRPSNAPPPDTSGAMGGFGQQPPPGTIPVQPPTVTGPPQVTMTPQLAQHATRGAAMSAIGKLLGGGSGQGQNTPGQFFRTVLASAMMGGAAGAETNMRDSAGAGWGAAGRGAGAVVQAQQQAQQRAQQQQQQQFENQLATQKDQRETAAAADESTYKKAITAQSNLATLRDAIEVQGKDLSSHDALVSRDKPLLDSFNMSGAKPIVGLKDIPENQTMTMKLPPGHSTVKWVATGTVPIRDASGKAVSYQNTYSAYDPEDTILVSPAMIKDWKDAGLSDSIPNFLNSSVFDKDPKTGQLSMKWADYNSVQQMAAPLREQQKQRDADAFTKRHEDDQLKLVEAQTRAENARTTAEQTTAGKVQYEHQKEVDTDKANKAFQTKGWEGLNPDQRYLLQDKVRDNIAVAERELNGSELKTEENSDDPTVKAAAYARAHDLQLSIEDDRKKLLGPQTGPATKTLPPDKVSSLVQKYSSGLPPTAATNFVGATKSLQSGLPLSTILAKLANSKDISPEDKTSIADAITKFNADYSPMAAQQQTTQQQATATVQGQANTAWAQENPNTNAAINPTPGTIHY